MISTRPANSCNPKRTFLAALGLGIVIAVLNSCDGRPDLSSTEKKIQESLSLEMRQRASMNVAAPSIVAASPAPGIASEDADAAPEGEEAAVLADAPHVPPPITRKHPTKVIVKLEVREVEKRLADGVNYTFWTFGGSVPGKFIRIRQNDYVEFHLMNHPGNKMPHNIDLHAVSGQGGGAAASFTAPGHESIFSFKALNPGLFVYHCATAPVGMHIANGMYGMILVEPREGLPKVDREFYVMQSEFYTKGKFGEAGLQPFDMQKALDEKPDYVVFNGSVGAVTGDKAVQANVGDRVRLFVGNGGPNLTSSFHVIGEIFDHVYSEGGSVANRNVQTTLIPAGGSSIVDFKVEAPGNYIMVDHAILRAFNKGAVAMMKVTGEENKLVYSGKIDDRIYQPEGSDIQTIPVVYKPAPLARNKNERIDHGKLIYQRVCIACHQAEAQGIPHAFPPLAKSDFLNADVKRAIGVVANGLTGKVTVNGETFESIMPQLMLSDEDVANALTFVLNNFGNSGGEVTPDQVAEVRGKPVTAVGAKPELTN